MVSVTIKYVLEHRINGFCVNRLTRFRIYRGKDDDDLSTQIHKDIDDLRSKDWYVVSSEVVYDTEPDD